MISKYIKGYTTLKEKQQFGAKAISVVSFILISNSIIRHPHLVYIKITSNIKRLLNGREIWIVKYWTAKLAILIHT